MSDVAASLWEEWTAVIQHDAAGRGVSPLVASAADRPTALEAAARDLARAESVAIVTGFCILRAEPPAAETDGPPGALAIARVLHAVGRKVALVSDRFGAPLLRVGCRFWGLPESLVHECPIPESPDDATAERWLAGWRESHRPTHLVAIERVGPSHTLESLAEQCDRACLSPDERRATLAEFDAAVPLADRGGCFNMRGLRLDAVNAPLHRLFEDAPDARTIGIGDGGNEIGMGVLPWRTFHRGLPGGLGGKIACRTRTDSLVVAGVSNWGGYAVGLGLAALLGRRDLVAEHSEAAERALIERLATDAGAVDGFSGRREPMVDGLPLDAATAPLAAIRDSILRPART